GAIFLEYIHWNTFTNEYTGIFIGSMIMLMTGVFDDIKGLSARQKFFLQLLAATIVIYTGTRIETVINPFGSPLRLGIFSIPITYIWLIGLTNSINLLDGLDGLAGGVCLLALLTFSILSYQHQDWVAFSVCLAACGGIIGFLYFNYHPASIFMGDTGSLFLGFFIAALAVKGFQKSAGNISLLVPIITLAVPIGDTVLAFFRRLNRGQHPFSPDKDHLHHRLLFLGLSHRQAVHIIYVFSFLFGLTAYLIDRESGLVSGLVIFMIIFLSLISLHRLGYLEAEKMKTYLGDQVLIQVRKEMAPLSMRRFWHKFVLLISDILMLNLALLTTYGIRFYSGMFENPAFLSLEYYFTSGIWLILTTMFILIFALNGLYQMRWDVSRFDQLIRVTRVIVFVAISLFLITLDPDKVFSATRVNILIYALVVIFLVNTGRLVLIQIEKHLSALEYAPHNTLLVGQSVKAEKILKEIVENPHLLYHIVGFVGKNEPGLNEQQIPNLGTLRKISGVIRDYGIEEVIIALENQTPDDILNVVAQGENSRVSFKLIPEMYDVISGLKTEETLGHPLIRLFPEHMLPWQWLVKRLFDFIFAVSGLIILLPVFLLIFLIQMFQGIHPVFQVENRVGRFGRIFGLVSFNTGSKVNAWQGILTHPLVSRLPHLLNLLIGSISLVGPKAETKETVDKLRQKVKFYNRRFMIRPGLTGWAQFRIRAADSLKMQEEQFRQDLFYLENMSIRYDIRILVRTFIWLILSFSRTGRK
ncbi:MAG: hypothetical protein E4H13_04180, partial [Calditrichales bacterium]